MFEGQSADISLFLNTVGDACTANQRVWNDEPGEGGGENTKSGRKRSTKAHDRYNVRDVFGNIYQFAEDAKGYDKGLDEPSTAPRFDTYSVTIQPTQGVDGNLMPAVKSMKPFAIDVPVAKATRAGDLKKGVQALYRVEPQTQDVTEDVRKLIRAINFSIPYAYSSGTIADNEGDINNPIYKRLTRRDAYFSSKFSVEAYTIEQQMRNILTGLSYDEEDFDTRARRYDAQVKMLDNYIKEHPEYGEAVRDFKIKIQPYIGDEAYELPVDKIDDFIHDTEQALMDVASEKTLDDFDETGGRPIADNILEEQQTEFILYRANRKTDENDESGMSPSGRLRQPDKELAQVKQARIKASEFYAGTDRALDFGDEVIPVTVVTLADTPDTRKEFKRLLGIPAPKGKMSNDARAGIYEEGRTRKANVVKIVTNPSTGEFRVAIAPQTEEGLDSSNLALSPIYSTTTSPLYQQEIKPNTELVFDETTGEQVTRINDKGTKVNKTRTIQEESPNQNTKVAGLLVVQPDDANGYTMVKPEEFGKKPGQVAYSHMDGRPFMHTVMSEDNECVWVSDRTGEVLTILDAETIAPSEFTSDSYERTDKFTQDVLAVSAEQAKRLDVLKLLASTGETPEVVQRKWDIALKELGFDPGLVGEFTYNDAAGLRWTTKNGHLMEGNKSYLDLHVGYDPQVTGNADWFNVMDNRANTERFVPMVRAMANRLLYLWSVGNNIRREQPAMDLDAIVEIVGGEERYNDLRSEGAKAGRNLVGEQVNLWLNEQAALLVRAVENHYKNKTRAVNSKLASGELTQEDIARAVDKDTGEFVYNPSRKKFDFDNLEEGTLDEALRTILERTNGDVSYAEITEEISQLKSDLLPTTSPTDRFQPTKTNKLVEKFIDTFREEYKKYIEEHPDEAKSITARNEAFKRAVDIALPRNAKDVLNDLRLMFDMGTDIEADVAQQESGRIERDRFNVEILSSAMAILQKKDTTVKDLNPSEQKAFNDLRALVDNQDTSGITDPDDLNTVLTSQENAKSGLDKLASGKAFADLYDYEIEAIQGFVTEANSGEVIKILKAMGSLGLLSGRDADSANTPGSDISVALKEVNTEEDLFNNEELLNRLVQRRAIVPLMSPEQFSKAFDDFRTRVMGDIADRASDKGVIHLDDEENFGQDEDKQYWWEEYTDKNGVIRQKYIGPVTGFNTQAYSLEARFRNEMFPEIIRQTKRYRLNHPALYRQILKETYDSIVDGEYQELPRNVFLSDQDRQDIRASKEPKVTDNRSSRRLLPQHLLWTLTGSQDIYDQISDETSANIELRKEYQDKVKKFGKDKVEEPEYLTEAHDKMREEEAKIVKTATQGKFDNLGTWLDAVCRPLISNPNDPPTYKVAQRIVCNPIIDSALDAVNRAIESMGGSGLTEEIVDGIKKAVHSRMRNYVVSLSSGKPTTLKPEVAQRIRDRCYDNIVDTVTDQIEQGRITHRDQWVDRQVERAKEKVMQEYLKKFNYSSTKDLTRHQLGYLKGQQTRAGREMEERALASYQGKLIDAFADRFEKFEKIITIPTQSLIESRVSDPRYITACEARLATEKIMPKLERAVLQQMEKEAGRPLTTKDRRAVEQRMDILRSRIMALCKNSLGNVNQNENEAAKYYRFA